MEAKKPNYIKCSYNLTFRDLCDRLNIDYDTSKHTVYPLITTTTLPDGSIGFQLTTEEWSTTEEE